MACVAVLGRYSDPPAPLDVQCQGIVSDRLDKAGAIRLELLWSDETEGKATRLRLTMQDKPLVEMAAVALALVLARQVAGLGQLDVTAYGHRADYRSLIPPAVLEVSGTEVPGELRRRHRDKIVQALSNPLGLDAFVVVCVFAASGHHIRFSFHRYGEQDDA